MMAPASPSSTSSDWTMLASIGSMFVEDMPQTSLQQRKHHQHQNDSHSSKPTEDQITHEKQPGGSLHLYEAQALVRLCHKVQEEARWRRCRRALLFPEPESVSDRRVAPRPWARTGMDTDVLQRQRERRADADSLRVLEYWTARREREARLEGRSDAASLRRLEYWTERHRLGVERRRGGPTSV